MELKKELLSQIQGIIASARDKAIRSVDTERVMMYWQIGRVIFEEEQQGEDRAAYGVYLIKTISLGVSAHFWQWFFGEAIGNVQTVLQYYFQLRTHCVRN